MAFVLDNSIAVRWLITDQRTPYSDFVLSRMTLEDVYVPAIFCIELTSALMKECNKATVSASAVDRFFLLLDQFDLHFAKAKTDSQLLYQASWHTPSDSRRHDLLAPCLGTQYSTGNRRYQNAGSGRPRRRSAPRPTLPIAIFAPVNILRAYD